jgi:ABC-type Zn2+ transport system substrate-binding protein/surface adhesin
MNRDEVVQACIAEMRAKLNNRTPDNAHEIDASIMLFSRTIAALETTVPAIPAEPVLRRA